MKDLTKKVVILNNFSSPYICEAIIVLRDYNPKLEGQIIDEAEKLVADYLEKHSPETTKKRPIKTTAVKSRRRNNHPRITVSVVVIVAALVFSGLYHYLAK